MEVTYGLMAVIGIITYYAWQKPELQAAFILNPFTVKREKQYYRLITSGFVHNNGMHLFLNLFTLYFFGGAVEKIFYIYFGNLGYVYYVGLFLSAIVVANIPCNGSTAFLVPRKFRSRVPSFCEYTKITSKAGLCGTRPNSPSTHSILCWE
jgi:membrane associated rhomboid family serine protease